MTDRILFPLDAAGKWALGYDSQQWIILHYRSPRWRAVSFIASFKRVLMLTLREKGIKPTPYALAALDHLPDTFREWLREHEAAEVAHLEVPAVGRRCPLVDGLAPVPPGYLERWHPERWAS